MMNNLEVNRDSILTNSYRDYLKMKEQHYCSKVEETICVKSSFHNSSKSPKMSPIKHKQMSNLLRGI